MNHTKSQVQGRVSYIRSVYAEGKLNAREIAQYESLPGWNWKRRATSFLLFTKARALARKQGFRNTKEFQVWRKPEGMPSEPSEVYVDSGWSGFGDFLGTGNVSEKNFMPFTKARALARKQGFKGQRDFYVWSKPEGVPSSPRVAYAKSGWCGWGDFLGTGNYLFGNFMSFTKARALVRKQKFTSKLEYQAWVKPEGMPGNPYVVYADSGWSGWGD